MKPILFLLLSLSSLTAFSQSKRDVRNLKIGDSVILECARKDVISSRFFVPAVKIGDKFYWRKKMKPLPGTWHVWNWQYVDKSITKN